MHRRSLLALAAAPLASPTLAQGTRPLRFVPIGDIPTIDPIVTTTYMVRTHGFLVWDTLYGLDAAWQPQPQMAEGHRIEADGTRIAITLRDGLRFHDGTPVLARDAVASIRRWGQRDALGQTLLARTAELTAPDDRTILFRLHRPFPLLFDALAKTSPPVCFIMPERLALTAPTVPIKDAIGSGPYRYLAEERIPGARLAYARFDGYRPRPEAAAVTSGGKRAGIERIEWQVIPDPATAAAALQNAEVDWWEWPTPDLVPLLRRQPGITVAVADPMGNLAALRLNHLHPPFDDPAARRALLPAIVQDDFMAAVAGSDPAMRRGDVGVFPPGSAAASDAGLGPLIGPRDLAPHGAGPLTLIGPSDYPNVQALTEVAADLFRRLGYATDYRPTDWSTVVARRANRAAPAQGGWNAMCTFFSGLDFLNPAVHLLLRANGPAAWPGWPSSAPLEALREAWIDAPDAAARGRLAAEIQIQAMQDLPYVPLGQFFQPTAHRRGLTGMLQGPTLFWNLTLG